MKNKNVSRWLGGLALALLAMYGMGAYTLFGQVTGAGGFGTIAYDSGFGYRNGVAGFIPRWPGSLVLQQFHRVPPCVESTGGTAITLVATPAVAWVGVPTNSYVTQGNPCRIAFGPTRLGLQFHAEFPIGALGHPGGPIILTF